jgi:hypothetical protein
MRFSQTTCYRRNDGDYLDRINGMRTAKLLVPIGEDLAELVGKIRVAAGSDKIRLIRMVSHGDSGHFEFCGMTRNVVKDAIATWSHLQELMTHDARLELHGCGIASDTSIAKPGTETKKPTLADALPGTFAGNSSPPGVAYMRKVREGFNATVVAAVNIQLQRESLMLEWQANTVTVFPDGTFQHDIMGSRPSDREATQDFAESWLGKILSENGATANPVKREEQLNWLISTCPQTKASLGAKIWLNDLKQKRAGGPIESMTPDP